MDYQLSTYLRFAKMTIPCLILTLSCLLKTEKCGSQDFEPFPTYDIRQGDVLYRITSSEEKTVEVCGFDFDSREYWTKRIDIPECVLHNSTTYRVVGTGNLILEGYDSDTREYDGFKWVTQFYNWVYPGHISLPSTIEYLNKGAFSECEKLKSVYFKNCKLETVPMGAFSYTHDLEGIHLPQNLKTIEKYAFWACGIEEISLPEGLEIIGDNAFSGTAYDLDPTHESWMTSSIYSLLKEIIIPNSTIKLGTESFYKPCKAERIVLSNALKDIPDNNFEQPLRTKEIIIPNSISSIGKNCFQATSEFAAKYNFEESSLESITLGKNLKTIGEGAFGEVPNLKTLFCLSDTPPTFVFEKANPQATVYVPKNRKSVYKNDSFWGKHFKNFVELPDILIQFQLKDYSMKTGETLPLRYIVTLFNNYLSISETWTSSDSAGLMVENGVAKAYKSGEYTVKYTITDSFNNVYEATCHINVEQGSGITPILGENNDIDFTQDYQVYDINGVIVNSELSELSHGIYIIRQNLRLKKIRI